MTLESLRIFCAVVEEGGFRRAADRVHRSQPAVSQQVKALELGLGRILFDRRGGRPTPAGERLYERARRLLLAADSIGRELADFDESQHLELKVGASDTTALYYLPEYIRKFSAVMPETRLVLMCRSSAAIGEQVLRGALDLGIVTMPVSHQDLESRSLFRQRLVLVTPRGHRLAGRHSVRLNQLREESFLQLEPTTQTGMLLEAMFRREGFTPRTVLDSGSFEVIKRYVSEGIGVAILPERVASGDGARLARVRVPGLPEIPIGAIWRRGAYRTAAERTFVDILAEHVAAPD